MDDLANAGAEAPADDLRSTIEAAFTADTGTDAPQGQEQAAPVVQAPVDPNLTVTEQQAADQRARDELGRFTKADQTAKTNAAVDEAAKAVAQGQQQAPVDQTAKPVGPPPGWSIQGKAAFDALPDAVKKDIAKREEEISQGFAKLTEYKGLDPYVETARSNGTTLPEALERYVAAENALETNPINGMLWLCERYQVHPAQLLEAIGQGQGHQQPGNQPDPFAPVMGHTQTLDTRLSQLEQARQQEVQQAVNSQIESFEADPANKFFPNVRKEMGHLIAVANQQGRDLPLKDAYEQACWANPKIRAVLISEQTKAQQAEANRKAEDARRAAGSLPTGSPIPGGTLAAHEPAETLRGEIERAFAGSRV